MVLPRPKRPQWTRHLRHAKWYLETYLGIAFADVVNIGVLVLSIFALLAAAAGVAVAIVAYVDTHSSGVKQEKAMGEQVTSLNEATRSLATVNDVLQKQVKLALRKPVVDLIVRCGPEGSWQRPYLLQFGPNSRLLNGKPVISSPAVPSQLLVDPIHVEPLEPLGC